MAHPLFCAMEERMVVASANIVLEFRVPCRRGHVLLLRNMLHNCSGWELREIEMVQCLGKITAGAAGDGKAVSYAGPFNSVSFPHSCPCNGPNDTCKELCIDKRYIHCHSMLKVFLLPKSYRKNNSTCQRYLHRRNCSQTQREGSSNGRSSTLYTYMPPFIIHHTLSNLLEQIRATHSCSYITTRTGEAAVDVQAPRVSTWEGSHVPKRRKPSARTRCLDSLGLYNIRCSPRGNNCGGGSHSWYTRTELCGEAARLRVWRTMIHVKL